jgi:hypothetical protein
MNIPKTVSYSNALKIYDDLNNQFKVELEKKEKEIVELKAEIKLKVSLMLDNWETMNDKVYAEKKKKKELETRNAELETRNLEFEIDLNWYSNQYSRYRNRTSTVILDEQAKLEAQLEVNRAEGLF